MKDRVAAEQSRCTRCGETKPAAEFYNDPSRRMGLSAWCRACQRKQAKQNRRPIEVRRPLALRNRLAKSYGITPEDYEAMVQKQGGLCAICGTAPKSKLRIDHDHATGKVRGLLCHNCNVILGFAHEDQGRLQECIDYLNDHAEKSNEQPIATIQVTIA